MSKLSDAIDQSDLEDHVRSSNHRRTRFIGMVVAWSKYTEAEFLELPPVTQYEVVVEASAWLLDQAVSNDRIIRGWKEF